MHLWRTLNINMMCKLKGKVKSGLGEASFWVDKISKVFEEKYGIKLFLGTLNIELEEDYILEDKEGILPNEYGGQYKVLIQKCKIFNEEVYILRPEINNKLGGTHPLNIVEIVSDKKLRQRYNLKDNDKVILEIYDK